MFEDTVSVKFGLRDYVGEVPARTMEFQDDARDRNKIYHVVKHEFIPLEPGRAFAV
jgi:hypothetical protein